MKYLAPIPKQFVDQSGLPLSNGVVHVYISGDTQHANVYQDADGEELIPNPARLDSNGAWLGFVTAGIPLDYVVEDKDGNVQFEYEKVVAGSGTANVAIEPVLTSGTKIAECWVDGELLELFAPEDSVVATLPIKMVAGTITNNGTGLTCTGDNAWAEGKSNEATGDYSHAEGQLCKAKGQASHAGGQSCETSGQNSFAHGAYLKTSNQSSCQAAFGMFNSDQKAMLVIGNGTAENNRKDAFKVDSNGDTWVMIGGVLTKATNVSGGGGGDQFVLARANMTTDFTNQEYQDCVDAVTAEQAVCVQFVMTGTTIQAQLTQITGGGTLVFEFTAEKYHYRWEVAATNNAHTVELTGKIFGVPIFDTLQDAITNEYTLGSGDIFETNGFHTSGDGGAARYKVSSTGTANGMDIVQLAAGKLAIAQLKGSAYTEQIGYEVSSAQADVTPYIKRLLALGVQEVKFYPTGGAPTRCYCIRDTLDLDLADYHNVGVHLKGADIGGTSGYFTWFNFQPSAANIDKIAIKIHSRTTEIENIALMYGDGMSDASNRGSSAGICFDSTGNTSYQTSSYGAVLKNLVIHGFNTAILSEGASPYIWHVDFEKITFASNNTHVSLDGLSYCTKFRNCLFNSPDVQSVYLGEPFTTSFDSCNFGIDDRGTTIIRSKKWDVPSAPVDEKRGMTLFINCNFEVEYRESAVPQNNRHLFVYADDDSQIDFEFDNCCFIYTPLTRENVFTDRMFSLGSGCSAIIRNSIGSYSDVNYSGNEFYGKDYDKYFFDENRPPRKKVGSVILQHCEGIDPFPFLDDEHLPCFKKDEDGILCSDTTGLDSFERIKDGTILFNLDRQVPVVKIAGNFVDCASAPSGVVRIGNELYNYVVIDGLRWITRNLNLRIPTRQHTIFDHLEWGQYYKYSDLSAIQAKLPSGWRIPNASDVSSIVGDGSSTRAHNLQSTGVSYWGNATNSTGFSALPSTWWYKPNTTPHSTFKQYAFYWTTATEGSNVKNIGIAPNAVSSGGWTSGEAASLWIPIRVCADA